MKVRLTETAIAAAVKRAEAERRRLDLVDEALPGLRLRVSPAGTKGWELNGRDADGRMRRFQLGRHPELGVSDAREAARKLRHQVRHEGADPVAEARQRRKVAKDAANGVGTLGAMMEAYRADRGHKLRGWVERERRIRAVFAVLIDRPAEGIKQTEIQQAVDDWPSKGSASLVARYLRPILRWGGRRGRCSLDLVHIDLPHTVESRERVLDRRELARVLSALTHSPSPYAAAMRLMILTACRREEAGAAKFGDVDFDTATWRLPRTKNGQPFTVQLPRQAVELIRAQIPAELAATGRHPEPEALVFANRSGGRLGAWDKATKLIHKASSTAGWHRHDLRRTAATMLGDMGEPGHIIEAVLNHMNIGSTLAATYNRSRYAPECRAALTRLADALDELAKDKAA